MQVMLPLFLIMYLIQIITLKRDYSFLFMQSQEAFPLLGHTI
jgi:hypothetical protein